MQYNLKNLSMEQKKELKKLIIKYKNYDKIDLLIEMVEDPVF